MAENFPKSPRLATVEPAETPAVTQLVSIVVGVVVVSALFFAREVLVPITLAVLLSFVLAPLVDLLRRIHVPRTASVLLSVVLGFGIIASLGSAIGIQFANLAGDLPRYQATIHEKIVTVRGEALQRVTGMITGLGHTLDTDAPKPVAPSSVKPQAGAEPKPLSVEVHQPDPSPIAIAERVLTPFLGPVETAFIVLVVSVFILLQREDLRDRLIRLFGSGDLHRTTLAMDDAAHRLSKYFLTQVFINAGFGAVIGVGLAVIGVPSAPLWGILAGLLRFVPYVGSALGGVMPVALAAAVDPGWSMMVWSATLFLTAEIIVSQVLEPMLYGHSTGLSPLAIVVAAIFWTWLWGPIGLILSTPVTLCLVVLGRHVPRMEFLDVLLGDRPALTPVENFYQRMLAGDPDEAEDQAEILLRDRSLSSYYDEVMVKGLRLAAADVDRGLLTAERLERIHEAARDLIDDLDEHDDAEPQPTARKEVANITTAAEKALPHTDAPDLVASPLEARAPLWRNETPVLCIAGRGPLDETAALMLAQLLGKHGIAAKSLPHAAIARDAIGQLDPHSVAMVCLCCLEITGSLSHLRYLVRRMRRRLPKAMMLVGLWPDEEDVTFDDERTRSAVGADLYAVSLHDAVQAVVTAVNETAIHEPAVVALPAAVPIPEAQVA